MSFPTVGRPGCYCHRPGSGCLRRAYKETMRGIHCYMGWSNIYDIYTSTNSAEDNPFAGPKTQAPGKVSVQMPNDNWLCRKLNKLNISPVEGYPSRSSKASGLLKDLYLRPAKSQAKWYGLYSDHKGDSTAVLTWNTDESCHNSSYSRPAYHLLHIIFPRRNYVSGKSWLEKLLLCVIRPQISTGACLKCSKTCSPSLRLSEAKAKAKVLQRSQPPL